MKKLLLSVVALTVFAASYAFTDPFKKNKEHRSEIAKSINQHKPTLKPVLKSSSTLVNTPQLVKLSWWDENAQLWNGNFANRYTYVNDRLVNELQLSYNTTDTFNKTEYTYDANGRYSQILYKSYDPNTHSFANGGRQTLTYSANNSFKVTSEQYDPQSSTWMPTNRYEQVYDSHGNTTLYKGEIYDGGLWIVNYAYSRTIVYYNNTEKIISDVDSSYMDSAMIAESKTVKEYNSNGQAIKITSSSYNNNVESVDEIDSIYYDSNGIPTMLIAFDNTMQPMAKLANLNWAGNFNPNIDLFDNQPVGYDIYMMGSTSWELAGRSSTTFPDNYGSEVYLEEEYSNNTFTPLYRYKDMYNSHFDRLESTDEDYDQINSTWIISNSQKSNFQYDVNNNKIEEISQYYNQSDSSYHYSQKMEYSDFITIAAGVNSNYNTIETKVFPNPTENGTVNITLKIEKANNYKFEIVDINGRIISKESRILETGLNSFEFNNLNKGMYFVVISSDDSLSRTKLIVK